MTRDLFQIKRDIEAGAYDQPLCGDALDRLAADLLRVQLPVVSVSQKTRTAPSAAGSVSEEKTE